MGPLESTPLNFDPERSSIRHLVFESTNVEKLLHQFTEKKGRTIEAQQIDLNQTFLDEKLAYLQQYRLAIQDCLSKDISLRNTQEFLQFFLDRLGLKVHPEFYESFSEGDVVEVYDSQSIQIFRNLEFFETTCYSLTELLTIEWYHLFERPEACLKPMLAVVKEILGGKVSLFRPQFKPHVIKEIMATPVQYVYVEFRLLGPVFDKKNSVRGFVVSSRARRVQNEAYRDNLAFI